MNAIGVLFLAAAAAGQYPPGEFIPGNAHVGGKKFLRHHVVKYGPPPAGGMVAPGDPNCPPGMGGPGGAGAGAGMPGAGGPGMAGPGGRRFPSVRSQAFFVEPLGMKVGWQTAAAGANERIYLPAQLTVPARYNFTQGYIYRLKLTDIPSRAALTLYPTIEVAPATPATDAFLTHNPIPIQFTEEDFDNVQSGNFVTKVIYLPDPRFQELANSAETLVSTRLEPGFDPILEADRRGTILMILRVGAIDLEMPAAGAGMMVAPGTPLMGPSTVLPPNALPNGTNRVIPENVPVEPAPVSAPTANPAPTPPAEPAPAPAPAAEPKPADPAPAPATEPKPAAEPVPPPAEPPAAEPPKA